MSDSAITPLPEMNVASRYLCQELYERSGWTAADKEYGDSYRLENGHRKRGAIPAYDLGYLLRKLPTPFDLEGVLGEEGTEWAYRASCDALETVDEIDMFYAATPEDAACKLAIGLFKQGVLRKGERNE